MSRFTRVYLEITNVCNLRCSFCPGTKRQPRFLSVPEFETLCARLRGFTDYLYFHLMGEPLLHPELPQLLDTAGALGFQVNLTTNAVLLDARMAALLCASPALHRVNLSLQAFEGNALTMSLHNYVNRCADFARAGGAAGKLVSLRLWNGGGADTRNGEILEKLHAAFPDPWQPAQRNTVLAPGVFFEAAEKFDWPEPEAEVSGAAFCLGLRNHIGVLCDGTVVPCCLDSEGRLALGNLFETPLEEILSSARAKAIYDGFSRRQPSEELCKHCGYAARF